MINVEVCDQQETLTVDKQRLIDVVNYISQLHGFSQGDISLAIVDDATIHEVNRNHLQHDYPTDVISFVFDSDEDNLEGEIIASSDTAVRESSEMPWSAEDELFLYFVHGMLHLVGMDDHEPADAQAMREAERAILMRWNIPGASSHGVVTTQ